MFLQKNRNDSESQPQKGHCLVPSYVPTRGASPSMWCGLLGTKSKESSAERKEFSPIMGSSWVASGKEEKRNKKPHPSPYCCLVQEWITGKLLCPLAWPIAKNLTASVIYYGPREEKIDSFLYPQQVVLLDPQILINKKQIIVPSNSLVGLENMKVHFC